MGWGGEDKDSQRIYFCRRAKIFLKNSFAYRGKSYEMAFTETHTNLWGYKYIHARWVKIICEG